MGTTNQRQDFHRANSNKIGIEIRTGAFRRGLRPVPLLIFINIITRHKLRILIRYILKLYTNIIAVVVGFDYLVEVQYTMNGRLLKLIAVLSCL